MKWGIPVMPFKISWFNKEVIIQDFRSVGWLGLLSMVAFFFIIPINMIFLYANEQDHSPFVNNYVQNFFQINFPFQVILIITIPIFLAVFLFRYLQVKQQADMVHSFPITRNQLYVHKIIVGLLFIIVPVLINGLVMMIVISTLNLSSYFSYTEVFEWIGTVIVFELLLFFAGVFVAMLTGISAVQAILTYIFLFFPVGFSLLVVLNAKLLFYGFPADYLLLEEIAYLSPLSRLTMIYGEKLLLTEVFIYLFITIVLFWLSLVFYQKRRLEAASHALSFSKLKPLFKYGATFCFMLVGGMYFAELEQSKEQFWIYFGYFTFSLIGYYVAEMVLQKTWRVFSNIKGYLFYSFIMVIVFLAVQLDFTGYEKRIPKLQDVERVYYSPYLRIFYEKLEREEFEKNVYEDRDNIATIIDMHKEIIAQQGNAKNHNSSEKAYMIYELKNGDKLIRQYEIADKNHYKKYLNSLYSSNEYKIKQFDLLHVKANDVHKIMIQSHDFRTKETIITKPEDIKQVVQLLQDELKHADYDLLDDERTPWGDILFTLSNGDDLNIPWYKGLETLEKWLADQNLLTEARVTAEEIEYVLVAREDMLLKDGDGSIMDNFERLQKDVNAVKITDREEIEECLLNASWHGNGKYIAAFYYKGHDYPEIKSFTEHFAPEFMKNRLAQ